MDLKDNTIQKVIKNIGIEKEPVAIDHHKSVVIVRTSFNAK